MAWLTAYIVVGVLLAEAGQRRSMFKGSRVFRVITYLCVVAFWFPGIIGLAFGIKGER